MIIFKSFSHISYTLEEDEYSKLALKMLSNSASINIIKPVFSKANGAKRFIFSGEMRSMIEKTTGEIITDGGLLKDLFNYEGRKNGKWKNLLC